MTPKLQGIAAAMAKLHHGLDDRAGKLLDRIAQTDQRGANVFAQAHKRIDAADGTLDEVNKLIDDLAKTNGGPTLDDSAESSGDPRHPQASWKGEGQGP